MTNKVTVSFLFFNLNFLIFINNYFERKISIVLNPGFKVVDQLIYRFICIDCVMNSLLRKILRPGRAFGGLKTGGYWSARTSYRHLRGNNGHRTKYILYGTGLNIFCAGAFGHSWVAECASSSGPDGNRKLADLFTLPTDPASFSGAVTIGGVTGFCAGFVAKKVSTVALFFLGSTFCVFQLAATQGYIEINWDKLENDVAVVIEKGKQTDMETGNPEDYINKLAPLLLENGTGTGGGFAAGFVLGVRHG
jgi:uncharacterized membrane protein (Fun14 family)